MLLDVQFFPFKHNMFKLLNITFYFLHYVY